MAFSDGKIGAGGTYNPFSTLQVGTNTFSGNNGMYLDGRVGISNHGNLSGLMLASTYNATTHPEYGLVFVQGPSTSSYNVWSISPDGPAKGNSLNFHYQSNSSNIHIPTLSKVEFTGGGDVIIKDGNLVVANGHGIDFSAQTAGSAAGATTQSELLDHYEEGVATISILHSVTNATITQGNTFNGFYTRVGNVCTVIGYTGLRTFQTTGAGNPRFSGLPFASKNGPYAIAHFTHNTFFTNSTAGYVETGSNYFYPITDNGTGVAAIAGTGSRYIMFSLTYITA